MSKEVSTKETNPAMRFTNAVILEAEKSSISPVQMSEFQKKIIQNSFIKISMNLEAAELKRLKKKESERDLVAVTWDNVNIKKLAQDVAATSEVGLDPLQKNHIHFVPYKNNDTGKYDITPIIGYRGTELKAMKFGLDIPKRIIVKLVFSNETFTPLFRDADNQVENYIHKPAENAFNRGEIIGGYFYHEFEDSTKNRLSIMTIDDILKRKPDYASAEFWGGQKPVWKFGKITNEKIEVPGWFEEMCFKTLFRKAHEDLTIDSEKISASLARVIQLENSYLYEDTSVVNQISSEADNKAGMINIDIVDASKNKDAPKKDSSEKEIVDEETGEIKMNF